MNIILTLFTALFIAILAISAFAIRVEWENYSTTERTRLLWCMPALSVLIAFEVIGLGIREAGAALARWMQWLTERLRDWIGLNGERA